MTGFNAEIAASVRSFGGSVAVAAARGVHRRDPVGGSLRILALTTGAPNARRAAEGAIELAHAATAKLEILFVSPPAGASPSRPDDASSPAGMRKPR
jgi:hypothetical protein